MTNGKMIAKEWKRKWTNWRKNWTRWGQILNTFLALNFIVLQLVTYFWQKKIRLISAEGIPRRD
jgi:hypothetical protein